MPKKHGHTPRGATSATYRCWSNMKTRCYNEATHNFHRYGGRGIRVCERWLSSFSNFLSDMGDKPDGMTLERVDTDANYEKSNCVWATRKSQANNRSTNHFIVYEGERKTIAEWAEITGINGAAIMGRLKMGWEEVRAITQRLRDDHE